jgi:hypothetical protein
MHSRMSRSWNFVRLEIQFYKWQRLLIDLCHYFYIQAYILATIYQFKNILSLSVFAFR